ncbi:MAG: type I glutamate--ammonia ligase [Pyrinomonadaceae bacterium]|nr:type I glutamate--ammonia ligase [Pyrinomonadaceae bacterium]MCX7640408.1 type I glutamate--ammonia ligase [Pyrinomonadaceae bacterium]MDW8304835.1 type I glutamate--ammonia ligase [Acidobacteriota bacterium]
MNNTKNILHYAAEHGVKFVSLRFTDFLGAWHHLTFPIDQLTEDSFEDGFGFDASSLRGWAAINESDMLLIPDPSRFWIDPFTDETTICLFANVVDPITKEGYGLDPRSVALRAENYLRFTGIADTAYFGPEAEFFVFDEVFYHNNQHSAGYMVNSEEGHWNTGRSSHEDGVSNRGYHIRSKEGYVPVPPLDTLVDLRNAISLTLEEVGIKVECHHHEVATAGQCEIDFKYSNLLHTADNLMLFKYVVKNTAIRFGKTATFMPKPVFGDNGSGMHCHQSLWKDGEPLFAGDGYAGLSELARFYIGGLLKHSPAIVAFAAPTTNSYKRLVPGFEAPVNLAYSARNRSAAIRIPMFSASPKAKRIEFRPPDPSCNPYLAFSAMLMAGLDGIENRIDPGEPLDKDIYDLPPEELANVPSLPGSLDDALKALENDCDFLLKGGVFTEQIIERWISYKREKEVSQMRLRPHPFEFAMYYDV